MSYGSKRKAELALELEEEAVYAPQVQRNHRRRDSPAKRARTYQHCACRWGDRPRAALEAKPRRTDDAAKPKSAIGGYLTR
jgi:hypothetical protein